MVSNVRRQRSASLLRALAKAAVPRQNAAMPDQPIARYSHRAKPYAQEAEFTLFGDHLHVDQGRRSGDFPYRDIVLIRLVYRPRNTTNEGYLAKLYRRDKHTVSLTNLSWKSLVDMERQDEPYRRFVGRLIGEVHAANPGVLLQAGMPRWLHLATAAAGLLAIAALAIVTGQAVLNGTLPVAMITGALTAYLAWWTVRYLGRNRPRGFTVDRIPEDVLPRTATPLSQ